METSSLAPQAKVPLCEGLLDNMAIIQEDNLYNAPLKDGVIYG